MALHLSREEFCLWAEGQKQRYERIAGEPVAMSPERIGHARIKNRVWVAPDRAVRRADIPCEALGDGVTVEIDEDTDYEPDAVINCGTRLSDDAIGATSPVNVVEVLSPSIQSIDLADKLADYFKVATIQHYLIVRVRRHEVILHSHAGSEIISRVINIGSSVLDPPGITIDLADLYPAIV